MFRRLSGVFWPAWALLLVALLFAVTASGSLRERRTVIVALGTTIVDSGLLDELQVAFEKKTGYFLKPLALGSGQAMAMGRRGEADALLVHDPALEKEFVAAGHGINRRLVMYNYYLMVGPSRDPAGIAGVGSVQEALRRIAAAGAPFISRGDSSGNDRLEKSLWREIGLDPAGARWYQETGLGMGHTLQVAADKEAYVLVDQATYFAFQGRLGLLIYVRESKKLVNLYHVIEVNPARWPKVNKAGAAAFADFLLSSHFQQILANFHRSKNQEPVFFTGKNRKEEEFRQ